MAKGSTSSTSFSVVTPPFSDNDKEREEFAFKQVAEIPKVTFVSELLVIRSLLVHLTLTAGQVITLPLWVLKTVFTWRLDSPEAVHSVAIFFSSLVTLLLTYVLPLSYDRAFEMMKTQSIYKLWAAYTLVKVVMKHVTKMHVFGHRILRGAIRTGSFFSVVIGVLLHGFITAILFYLYALYNATYLTGLFGKPLLFFSACFHIQAVITKKWLPKVTENPPAIEEPIQRMVLLIAVVYHISYGTFDRVVMMIGFEYAVTFIRFFLCSLTDDAAKWFGALSKGADVTIWQYQNNDARLEESLIVLVPTEVFAVGLVTLIIKGPVQNSIAIGGFLVVFALIGPIVINKINVTKPKETPPANEKKEKKDKKVRIDPEASKHKRE
jgi:hypothetical protein